MKFLILLSILLINSAVAIPDKGIEQKPIIFNQENTYLDKFQEYDTEIQNLINKIEILERNILFINQRLDSLNTASIPSENTQQQNINDIEKSSDKEITKTDSDIFDIKENIQENDIMIPNTLKERKFETEKELYDLALAALKEGNYEESQEKFLKFIEIYPKSLKLGKVYFWYGEVFFRQKSYNEASINYLKSYKQEQKGEKSSDALLKLALSLGNSGKKQDACLIITKLQSEFKDRSVSSIKSSNDAKIKFDCSNINKVGNKK